jgi:hypothetical protein
VKAKEKRIRVAQPKFKSKGMRYGDLPSVYDPTLVVLEKTVPGVKELAREEAFV